MTDNHPQAAPTGPYRRKRSTWGRGTKISIEGPPSDEEVAAQPHKGEAADRFTLYTPEQIEAETRNVRLDITFGEPLKIRDQAEMIIACMHQIIGITREHDIGSIRQRINAHREAASLGATLSFFNNRTPYGYRKKKGRQR